ncbi:MAG TPA: translation initiation factor IF-2 [Geminicoccaceae bacterium]|jgi:translation initiation factor IF-2|nr:translation initiation factor IF-2 [Geminicoccaceae bacterium]
MTDPKTTATDTKEQERNPRISLSRPAGRLELTKTVDSGMVRQSFSHGRSKSVAVEVKRKRQLKSPGMARPATEAAGGASARTDEALQGRAAAPAGMATGRDERAIARRGVVLKPLTDEEKSARVRALSDAKRAEEDARRRSAANAQRQAEDAARRQAEEQAAVKRQAEEEARKKAEEEARRRAEEAAARLLAREEDEARRRREAEGKPEPAPTVVRPAETAAAAPTVARAPARPGEAARPKVKGKSSKEADHERGEVRRGVIRRETARGRVVLDSDSEVVERRTPSLAAIRRQREREKRQLQQLESGQIVREVVLPETITVSELANRMAVRGADVIKQLMKMGVMATINQVLDADTAELLIAEFGHQVKRVSEADVEIGLEGEADLVGDVEPRAPVVTVMGHVDHGKTSLLDALRRSDVAAHEAGGITQHIGAYQVDVGSGRPVTFIDTPGHAAFTEMRARGAKVTDIVVLVVAADDGVMPQTIEAVNHAKAAAVPIVVAINKIDRPDANPERVKQALLNHEVVLEEYGGDVLHAEVSATQRTNLERLLEAIQLQAEILELRANPNRDAQGVVIEAKLDRGRGVVATVLIQRGTLRVGDIIVCGGQWGRVRAMVGDRGQSVEAAGPAVPVEILGLDGVPDAGDPLVVVDSERRAREITEYRLRKRREQNAAATGRGSVEEMFSQLGGQASNELPVVVKSDVHGSMEAIVAGLEKLGTEEVSVRVLHSGVGAITESDVTLAMASRAVIIGFNVRANAQARELARREGVEIRYHSIIYELLDEVKAHLSGLLAPSRRETTLGHAEVREVFTITKVGKIAGCRVVDGLIRRGARVRLLRDDVVIHDGALGSLRRFKEDVREVRDGFECGIGIEGWSDLREGDVIEAYEVEQVARTL